MLNSFSCAAKSKTVDKLFCIKVMSYYFSSNTDVSEASLWKEKRGETLRQIQHLILRELYKIDGKNSDLHF